MGSELNTSKLGTKEYWDTVYDEELTNFHDIGDEGEIWFGQESVDKMRDWVVEHIPSGSSEATHAPFIVEIGVGNGNLLFALLDEGYDPRRIAGIDYSADAVRLARAIAPTRGGGDVRFEVTDFLTEDLLELEGMDGAGWDLVLDKGTYDAMALMPKDETGEKPSDTYPLRVAAVLKPEGHFLITSCNFTHEELLQTFVTAETGLTYHSRIDHPSISFGGVTGSTYCSAAFQKKTIK